MINTLRITSVLVALGAMALLGMSVVYGIDKDTEVQDLVKAQGPVALFEQNQGKAAAQKNVNAKHPLVSAAEQFALLMNPPKPPTPPKPRNTRGPSNIIRPKAASNVTSRIPCLGICYNAEDPNLSFALIDKPGKGQRWVGINDRIDHHVVHEIRRTEIVLMNGDQEEIVPFNKKPVVSLIKGENDPQDVTRSIHVESATVSPGTSRMPSRPSNRPQQRPLTLRSTTPSLPTPEERAKKWDEALAGVQKMAQNEDPNLSEDEREEMRVRRQKVLDALIKARDRARLQPSDADQLHNLGKDFLDRHAQSLDANDM